MSQVKAKTGGETPTFSKTFGSGLRQVAPNEHVKNGDSIVSSTSGKTVTIAHSPSGTGKMKHREPEHMDNVLGNC